ncbi:sugar ABC transporter ATP-binding protein [Clostridia bacterium]|nr:sugar ABC transporter ATP-binding protein [Clostridia bacterium]
MYAIQVSQVNKVYQLYHKPIDRLKESLQFSRRSYHQDFYALQDISFQIKKGETVGIIGTNGAGKSTILKIITGVLSPTNGEVKIQGKISALLELGAGFNMDYTGVENIYMNGTMMGYRKQEMTKKLPEILDFADIGEFVHQPVKTYSSGMFVRLAFALAINVEPEILIVDEALSVGDVFFQAKCYKRMEEIRKSGTTILMVTHDMGSILKYCHRTILFNQGKLVMDASPKEVVDVYKKILVNQYDPDQQQEQNKNWEEQLSLSQASLKKEPTFSKKNEKNIQNLLWKEEINWNRQVKPYGDGRGEIIDFALFNENEEITNLVMKNEEFTVKMKVHFHENFVSPIFAFTIKDKMGTEISGTNTLIEEKQLEKVEKGSCYIVSFTQKMQLQGGEYLISLGCTGFEEGKFVVLQRLYDILNITVISNKNTVGIFDMDSQVRVILE